MRQFQQFSITIEPDGDRYQSHCPELELSTSGTTADEARANLVEAIELFFELADASDIAARLNRPPATLSLCFLLENDSGDGYRAIALEDTGHIQEDVLEDLCERIRRSLECDV